MLLERHMILTACCWSWILSKSSLRHLFRIWCWIGKCERCRESLKHILKLEKYNNIIHHLSTSFLSKSNKSYFESTLSQFRFDLPLYTRDIHLFKLIILSVCEEIFCISFYKRNLRVFSILLLEKKNSELGFILWSRKTRSVVRESDKWKCERTV